jgi:hypothetical protein
VTSGGWRGAADATCRYARGEFNVRKSLGRSSAKFAVFLAQLSIVAAGGRSANMIFKQPWQPKPN